MEIVGKKINRILFFITVVSFFAMVVTTECVWAQETEKSTPAKGEDGWRWSFSPVSTGSNGFSVSRGICLHLLMRTRYSIRAKENRRAGPLSASEEEMTQVLHPSFYQVNTRVWKP